MRSADQLQRLTQLVPFLVGHPGVSITQTAETFGTTPAVVMKDLEVIQFCGLPGGLPDDLFEVDIDEARRDGEIWVGNADVLARPMTLTSAQATTLLVALETLVALGSDAARSAREKLSDACGRRTAGIEVDLTSGDPEARRILAEAAERRRVVVISHRGRDGVSELEVEPARLRVCDGATYLDAWSRPRRAWRSFRLDRVVSCRATKEPFEPRPGLAEHTAGWFQDSSEEITLEVDPRAAWVIEHHPTTSSTPTERGLSITLPVGTRQWAVELILRLGADVLRVADEALRNEAAEEARRALAAYDD